MDAAMEQDEALKERVEFMKQGASYMQEESKSAASNPYNALLNSSGWKNKVFKVWKAEKRICRSMEKWLIVYKI